MKNGAAPVATTTEFFDEIVDEMVAIPLPPSGSSLFQQITQRHLESVLFKTSTPQEAGEAMYTEVLAEVS